MKKLLLFISIFYSVISHAQSWYTVGNTGFSQYQIATCATAVSLTGVHYVAYVERPAPGTWAVSVMKFNDTAWVDVGPHHIYTTSPNGVGVYKLFIDSAGTPHLAIANTTVRILKFDGNAWVNAATPISPFYREVVINFDKNAVPYVLYNDSSLMLLNTTVLHGLAWGVII